MATKKEALRKKSAAGSYANVAAAAATFDTFGQYVMRYGGGGCSTGFNQSEERVRAAGMCALSVAAVAATEARYKPLQAGRSVVITMDRREDQTSDVTISLEKGIGTHNGQSAAIVILEDEDARSGTAPPAEEKSPNAERMQQLHKDISAIAGEYGDVMKPAVKAARESSLFPVYYYACLFCSMPW